MDKVFLCDMDGTICNYEAALRQSLKYLDKLCRAEGRSAMGELCDLPEIDYDSCNLWKIEDEYPVLKRRIDHIKSGKGWWSQLPAIPDGLKIYQAAVDIGFTPCILTKGPRSKSFAWGEKVDWVHEHLGCDVEIHVVTDKRKTYGRVLFDDYPPYMLDWLKFRPRGLGIMPSNIQNRDFNHPQVIKWDGTNLDEIILALARAYIRKDGEHWQW